MISRGQARQALEELGLAEAATVIETDDLVAVEEQLVRKGHDTESRMAAPT